MSKYKPGDKVKITQDWALKGLPNNPGWCKNRYRIQECPWNHVYDERWLEPFQEKVSPTYYNPKEILSSSSNCLLCGSPGIVGFNLFYCTNSQCNNG